MIEPADAERSTRALRDPHPPAHGQVRVVNDSLVYACGDRVYRWRR